MGATEDAAIGRPARPGVTVLHCERSSTLVTFWNAVAIAGAVVGAIVIGLYLFGDWR